MKVTLSKLIKMRSLTINKIKNITNIYLLQKVSK